MSDGPTLDAKVAAEHDPDVLPPNPKHQRWAFLCMALIAALAVWSLLHLVHELDAARSMSLKSVRGAALQTLIVAGVYFHGVAASLGLLGLFLVTKAVRIWRSRQYPPPGAWIVRRTRIRRGPRAMARAAFSASVGVLLVIFAVQLPDWADAQLSHLLAGALQTPDTPPDAYLPHIE